MLLKMDESEVSICEVCWLKITDRFYLQVGTKKLHNRCLKCRACMTSLCSDTSCYEKNEQIFCRTCYFKLFSIPNCLGCKQEISSSDFVMQARKTYYHVNCFRCSLCSVLLQKGDKYGIRNLQLLCEPHYLCDARIQKPTQSNENEGTNRKIIQENPARSIKRPSTDQHFLGDVNNKHIKLSVDIEPLQLPSFLAAIDEKEEQDITVTTSCDEVNRDKTISAFSSSTSTLLDKQISSPVLNYSDLDQSHSISPSTSSGDEEKLLTENPKTKRKSRSKDGKPKRIRTTFKNFQLLAMKDLFDIEKNPDSAALQKLSEKVGLTKRVLQVWFQNARAKHRKGLSIFSDAVVRTSLDEQADKKQDDEKTDFDPESSTILGGESKKGETMTYVS